MSIVNHAEYTFGDTIVAYSLDERTGQMGLIPYPAALASQTVARREVLSEGPEYAHLPGWDMPAREVIPLVQVKWIGAQPPDGFAQGRTMRGSPATSAFTFERQEVRRQPSATQVITHLRTANGYTCAHTLTWQHASTTLEVTTAFHNRSDQPVSLELLTSFVLDGITPFASDDAPDRLLLHRFRSAWSVEGKLDTQSIEQLHLERSWSGHGVRCERYGQVGSMPVNGFFPFIAIEDHSAGVLWGAQLAWAGSWQMEAYRRDDCLSISGGLADREFGHWVKTLAPGESLVTPPATLATVAGDLDALCHRLTSAQQPAAERAPAVESELPIIFNEWCTSWGRPTHQNMIAVAERLRGSPVKYLVIDAGWYAPLDGNWSTAQGDWIPNPAHYPTGLAATTEAIRQCGLVPGLWFEFEVAGESATAFHMIDHLLKRDGLPLTVGCRRFWDLNDPFVVEYLTERVIHLLRDMGMGYLKVDYNETLGMGVDGAESLGEGLRRQVEGTYRFFERIHEMLPDLVIENCSSGGHRLEPSMLARCSMGSFSDAHETREIPIVAANLHRLILPRQSQIWAALRKSDDDRRLRYLLSATFLGRMCLSGDITELSDHQWSLALRAQHLYQRVAPIIKQGRSLRHGPVVTNYRHPRGWQAILRLSEDGREALAVAHSFGADVPPEISIALPGASNAGNWRIADSFHPAQKPPHLASGQLIIPFEGEYDACVVLLVSNGIN